MTMTMAILKWWMTHGSESEELGAYWNFNWKESKNRSSVERGDDTYRSLTGRCRVDKHRAAGTRQVTVLSAGDIITTN